MEDISLHCNTFKIILNPSKTKRVTRFSVNLSYFTTFDTLNSISSSPESSALLDSCLKQLHDGYTLIEFILLLSPLFNTCSSSNSSTVIDYNSLSSFCSLLRDNIHTTLKSIPLDPYSLESIVKSWIPSPKSLITLQQAMCTGSTEDLKSSFQIQCDVVSEFRSTLIHQQRLCSCHHLITECYDHCKTSKNILIDKLYSPALFPFFF